MNNTFKNKHKAILLFGATAVGKTEFLNIGIAEQSQFSDIDEQSYGRVPSSQFRGRAVRFNSSSSPPHFHSHPSRSLMSLRSNTEQSKKNIIEIISADSRQVYKDISIATAYPDETILQKIPHHLIGIKSYDEEYNVFEFVQRARQLIIEIISRGNIPLVMGGTAFYLYNLWKGLPETPASDPHIRSAIQQEATEKGQAYMFQCLENIDPIFAASITNNDSYRTTRALEVFRQTGKRISEYAQHKTYQNDISFQVYGFSRARNILYKRIEKRVEAMLHNGLYTEVHNFYKKTGFYRERKTDIYNAIKTIGVQEFLCNEQVRAAWDKGDNISETLMADCVALIKRNSKRYAKRQITFFKRFPSVHWFDIDNTEHNTYEDIWKYIMQQYHS